MDPPMRVPQFGSAPISPAFPETDCGAVISRLEGAFFLDAAIGPNDEEAIVAHGPASLAGK
jgi:hypothetical protein